MLRFRVGPRPRKLKVEHFGGREARIQKLRQLVSGLVRYERIEMLYSFTDETRQYAERLIHLAVKHGDKHKATMELADYWLLEKDLVHKLFKVLVPRLQNCRTCYTNHHRAPGTYPIGGFENQKGVLELKGNPWPSVVPEKRDKTHMLSNVLLAAARKDFYEAKRQQQLAQSTSTEAAALESAKAAGDEDLYLSSAVDETLSDPAWSEFSSSVDPPAPDPPSPPPGSGHKGV